MVGYGLGVQSGYGGGKLGYWGRDAVRLCCVVLGYAGPLYSRGNGKVRDKGIGTAALGSASLPTCPLLQEL